MSKLFSDNRSSLFNKYLKWQGFETYAIESEGKNQYVLSIVVSTGSRKKLTSDTEESYFSEGMDAARQGFAILPYQSFHHVLYQLPQMSKELKKYQ